VSADGVGGVAPDDDLGTAFRLVWVNFPTLVVATLVCTVSLVPGFVLSPGITPIAVICAVCFGAPVWAATIAMTDRITASDEVTISEFFLAIRTRALDAWRTAAVPAAVVVCALAALVAYTRTPSVALLVPLVVAGAASVVILMAATQVFSLRAAGTWRGKHLWWAATVLALSYPWLTLGVMAFGLLGLLAGIHWAVSIMFLVPAPLALLCSVASRTARRNAKLLPVDDESTEVSLVQKED